jgi:small subunit ribosomal protein S16
MNEPADGATTMKKKAADKLAAKANPVVETPAEAVVDVQAPAEVEAVVDVQAPAESNEAEVPASVETNATEVLETSAEATPEAVAEQQ